MPFGRSLIVSVGLIGIGRVTDWLVGGSIGDLATGLALSAGAAVVTLGLRGRTQQEWLRWSVVAVAVVLAALAISGASRGVRAGSSIPVAATLMAGFAAVLYFGLAVPQRASRL